MQFTSIRSQKGHYLELPLWVGVDLEAIAVNEYSTLPKAQPLLKPLNQIGQFISRIFVGWVSYPLQRSSHHILEPPPTAPEMTGQVHKQSSLFPANNHY